MKAHLQVVFYIDISDKVHGLQIFQISFITSFKEEEGTRFHWREFIGPAPQGIKSIFFLYTLSLFTISRIDNLLAERTSESLLFTCVECSVISHWLMLNSSCKRANTALKNVRTTTCDCRACEEPHLWPLMESSPITNAFKYFQDTQGPCKQLHC